MVGRRVVKDLANVEEELEHIRSSLSDIVNDAVFDDSGVYEKYCSFRCNFDNAISSMHSLKQMFVDKSQRV